MAELYMAELWLFLVALSVAYLLPGPDMILLLQTGARQGKALALTTAIGLGLARACHVALAGMGLATLFKVAPWTFDVVRLGGAAYLLWLGIQCLRASMLPPLDMANTPLAAHAWRAAFQRGLLTNLLNPKAIIFYMAFLPLFIDPARHQGVVTFATMALIIFVMGLAYCSVLIGVGNLLRRRILQHPRVGLLLKRVAGVFLIGFGVRLGVSG